VQLHIPTDNRPVPLVVPSVPMWADEVCQMSFGERAALEGILSQSKPRVAIEIGTYEGGSLRFLAAHCEHVHTLDLYDLVVDRTAFENVTFHTGDSKEVLPELLRSLEAQGLAVDLALVDGDHSADGVYQDLANLLGHSATRSTVIILHDTMNAGTRAGIERVELSTHPRVVYHELDFIPGYEFVGGHFDGQLWGGLGLVVTGDRRVDGYRDAPAQTRYREPFQRFHEAVRMSEELSRAHRELELSQHWLESIQSSLSWRITSPLRTAKRALEARRGRH
jgi:Methyltransferase domain